MVMQQSQKIAAELQDVAGQSHRAGAGRHGSEDHATGHESSRQAHEHSNQAYLLAQEDHEEFRNEHGGNGTTHEPADREIAALATSPNC
jgi:hypothetical protein